MNYNLESKTVNIIRILQILWDHSDYEHRLTQGKIIEYLYKEYNIEMERKAVKRALENLQILFESEQDSPIEIVLPEKNSKREGNISNGAYIRRLFDDSELKLIIDSVLASRHINAKYSDNLVKRLCCLSNKYFLSHVKYTTEETDLVKSNNKCLFDNIDIISEAIAKGKQIAFDYNNYGADKKLYKTSSQIVSPYRFILRNQHYFLISFDEKHQSKGNYRVDKMTNVNMTADNATLFEDVYGGQNLLTYTKMLTTYPYMFTDEPKKVEFLTDKGMLGEVFDYFGTSTDIAEQADGKYKVSVYTSPMAMEIWALKYLTSVEILSPQSLRDKIIEDIKGATAKYKI